MTEPTPSFFARIPLAFVAFWKILFNRDFAAAVRRLRHAKAAEEGPIAAARLHEAPPDSALQLLGLLQRDGRFVDFIEEEVAAYSDTEVGAAARVVHEGCRKVLQEHFHIAPVRGEQEGAPVTLEKGFDASAVRLTGNVVGEPPFRGKLAHRGWQAAEVKLPKLATGHDVRVLAPAEVEL